MSSKGWWKKKNEWKSVQRQAVCREQWKVTWPRVRASSRGCDSSQLVDYASWLRLCHMNLSLNCQVQAIGCFVRKYTHSLLRGEVLPNFFSKTSFSWFKLNLCLYAKTTKVKGIDTFTIQSNPLQCNNITKKLCPQKLPWIWINISLTVCGEKNLNCNFEASQKKLLLQNNCNGLQDIVHFSP